MNVSLYRDSDLISKLKPMVVTDGTNLKPTGIPPYIKVMQELEEIKADVSWMRACLKEEVIKELHEYLESRAAMNGQMTRAAFEEALAHQRAAIVEELQQSLAKRGEDPHAAPADPTTMSSDGMYIYEADGKEQGWCVPETFRGFNLKATYRRSGWDLWLNGNPAAGIMPYRKMKGKLIPDAHRKNFNFLRSFFKMCESNLGDGEEKKIDEEKVADPVYRDQTYQDTTAFLKRRASYIWQLPQKSKMETWSIAYWQYLTKNSQIRKDGTEEDKACLVETPRNKARKRRQNQISAGV